MPDLFQACGMPGRKSISLKHALRLPLPKWDVVTMHPVGYISINIPLGGLDHTASDLSSPTSHAYLPHRTKLGIPT
jgi:hypothetical protein